MNRRRLAPTFVLPLMAPLVAQHEANADPSAPMFVAPASSDAATRMRGFRLADGLTCDLVAAEPDLCNGVAFTIDGLGRVFVAETFRINDGVFDDRNYMQWKDADLATTTVAERVAIYHRFLPEAMPRYAAFSERVRRLVDSDRNGTLDHSTVFAAGFNDPADGIGSGVLAVGDDLFFTNIPKLWRLRDRDGDGVADERHVVHDGYGVHTSLIGHDLHGLVLGPDRRLYFSIGDRGLNVQQGDRHLFFPHEGAVLRCELDGSGLTIVHRGLRNPQELAFDDAGDLFTGDNNSDGGDRARLVQIVPGADSGWRIGFQWLDDRGAWNRERMWWPRHPQQTATILPPIANFADGPSGLTFDPGVGLPERFRGCFFLCDFRGGASYSGVHALRFERDGAGYQLASSDQVIWNVLATDVDFAPDGSLWVLDWVDGWNKSGKGRLYRVRSPLMANDLTLRNGAALLASDLRTLPPVQLRSLLAHADRRVRQAATFALVDLDAGDVLQAVAADRSSRRARLQAIHGLGVLGRRDAAKLTAVIELLGDGDADVRAVAARVLGDARVLAAETRLAQRLDDPNARVMREAALALANLRFGASTTAMLLDLLRRNDDHDAVLRHAAVFALAEGAGREALLTAAADTSAAVRLGVLLALARRADPAVAMFLDDAEPRLVDEAARVIYERPIAESMPALARLCYDAVADREVVAWRAINANRLLGEVENGEALVHFAGQPQQQARMRCEALQVLGEWRAPHGQCRVVGNWRPCAHSRPEIVVQCLLAKAPELLADAVTATATAEALGQLGDRSASPLLAALVGTATAEVAARVAALDALATLGAAELATALAGIDGTAPVRLRQRAVTLLSHTAPERAVPVLASLLDNAPLGERQAAFAALGNLPHASATEVLTGWLDRLDGGEVDDALQLDLLLACGQHGALAARLQQREAALTATDPLAPFQVCREGGDAEAGRAVFFDHEATRCTRCHTAEGQGGNAGPRLDGVGGLLTRDQLVAALVTPSARIAEGFGATTITLHNGDVLVGIVTKDQGGAVTLVDGNGKQHTLAVGDIASRVPNGNSAMPPMGGTLTRRQLRDVVAYLASRR
ncbi:MAG: HEAT repeat domain-containing protein [Planctomycetes bacterium]|nr:HEAT repeat domain-containing protein [Planctomycetota bacterium]